MLLVALALGAACGSKSGLRFDDEIGAVDAGEGDAALPDAAPPPLGCPTYPTAPSVLVEDESIRPATVARRGDALFVGVIDQRPLTEPQTGALYRVPVMGGPHSRVALSAPFYGGGLLLGPDYFVYHEVRATRTGASAWSFAYPALIVEGAALPPRVLDTELEPNVGRAAAMAFLADDRIVFSRHRSPPTTEAGELALYDVRAAVERTLRIGDVRQAVSGGRSVYAYLREGGDGVVLRVDSSEAIEEVARFDDFNCCWLWAADDEDTLYLHQSGDVVAWPLVGPPRDVATHRERIARAAVDGRFLYWADSADILHVDKRGGEVRRLVEGGTSYVENPPRVLVLNVP
jgi:hypothetical protein